MYYKAEFSHCDSLAFSGLCYATSVTRICYISKPFAGNVCHRELSNMSLNFNPVFIHKVK